MKILIGIPVIRNGVVFAECMEQVLYKRDVTIIVVDNNSDEGVKEKLKHYRQYPQVNIIENKTNEFVNSVWNLFMKFFIKSDKFDRLIILNSDLTLNTNWCNICTEFFQDLPKATIVPKISDDKRLMYEYQPRIHKVKEIPEGKGFPGVFITLSKDQANIVYPLPDKRIKVWFGDTIIYETLSAAGYPVMMSEDLLAFHHVSTSINSIEGIHNVIEQDKKAWNNLVKFQLEERIKSLKSLL